MTTNVWFENIEARPFTINFPPIPMVRDGEIVSRVHPKSGERIQEMEKLEPLTVGPGVNVISTEEWDEIKKNEVVDSLITTGTFDEIDRAETLLDLDENNIQRVLEKCVDVTLLSEWLAKYGSDLPMELRSIIEMNHLKLTDPIGFEAAKTKQATARARARISNPRGTRSRRTIKDIANDKQTTTTKKSRKKKSSVE